MWKSYCFLMTLPYVSISCFQYFTIINSAIINNLLHIYFWFAEVMYLQGRSLPWESLDWRITATEILFGIAKFPSRRVVSLFIPTSSVWKGQFLQSFVNRISFTAGKSSFPTHGVSFHVFLAILSCLFFHRNFRINLSNSVTYVLVFLLRLHLL